MILIYCLLPQRQAVAREPAASDVGSAQLDAGVGGADAVLAARQRTLEHQTGVSCSQTSLTHTITRSSPGSYPPGLLLARTVQQTNYM